MVGLTLAIALARAGLKVAVIDAQAPAAQQTEAFDGRASAIARGSQRVLDGLGLWAAMAPHAAPIRQIRVSDGRKAPLGEAGQAAPFFLHYDASDVDGEALGYIIENRFIRQACFQGLEGLASLTLLAPCRVVGLEADAGLARVRLDDGRTWRAPLVVAADGRGS